MHPRLAAPRLRRLRARRAPGPLPAHHLAHLARPAARPPARRHRDRGPRALRGRLRVPGPRPPERVLPLHRGRGPQPADRASRTSATTTTTSSSPRSASTRSPASTSATCAPAWSRWSAARPPTSSTRAARSTSTASVPHDRWNLWIGHAEPHKVTTAAVTTPWALSVIVPNNEAVLVTSRHGRRVVTRPVHRAARLRGAAHPLKLSKGKSKDGHTTVTTCFLRVQGGRVADNFEVESADFVRFRVKLALAGSFEGAPERWFNVEDPVKLLADTVRARVREAARTQTATQILQDLPALVRQALFGEHSPALPRQRHGPHRRRPARRRRRRPRPRRAVRQRPARGRLPAAARSQARRRVESTRHRDQIDAEEHLLQRAASQRMAETSRLEAHDSPRPRARTSSASPPTATTPSSAQAGARAGRRRLRPRRQAARSESAAALRVQSAEAEARAAELANPPPRPTPGRLAEIDQQTAAAFASADAVRLGAIQRELVGALHAAADSEVMKAAATNMNLVALLGGKSPADLLARSSRHAARAQQRQHARARHTP
jgi:major vault protein